MKQLKKLYKQYDNLVFEITQLVQARIVKFCDDNNYQFSGYLMEFKDQEGELIENKKTDAIFEMTNEQIRNIGFWNAQFHYDPQQFLGKGKGHFRAYNAEYMLVLKELKKIAKTL